MKRIAILVIAATNQPVYIHYIKTYWTELIRHLRVSRPHIDVYLLFENGTDIAAFSDLRDHIIQDPNSNPESRCPKRFHTMMIPGILSKTVHAFRLLQGQYDVYFRTNLSSMIRLPYFDQFVQKKSNLIYSGSAVWHDTLRQTLISNGDIGPGKSIESLSELDGYPGNTFISGMGYFLNAKEVSSLLRRKYEIRYDIIDDVSMGLMFAEHEHLPGFRITVHPQESVAEIKSRIRRSNACQVRLEHFPVDKAQRLWEHIEHGHLWQVAADSNDPDTCYKIYFPLFDHIESRSNEVRLTHEGLVAHSQVSLVDDPESADYLVFCQNHLVGHCPFHTQFRPIKDRFIHKTIMLDFDDNPHMVYDRDDFRWKLYFKRSCVDRRTNQPVDYGDLPILPIAYAVVDDMVDPPQIIEGHSDGNRTIAVSCLFEDAVCDFDLFELGRCRLLKFAKGLAARTDYPMQIGLVSECGPAGRSGIDERYKQCLFDSKIILHANPDPWEGDARTWEAVSSGALVFVDRMCHPIDHPLVDGEHVVFYDLTDKGMEALENRIIYYLKHDDEREKIGRQGRTFALERHRSINRINEIIRILDAETADLVELEAIVRQQRKSATGPNAASDTEGRPFSTGWIRPVVANLNDGAQGRQHDQPGVGPEAADPV